MKLEYFILLGLCFAGPLVLSFSKKLLFYKYPKRLFLSILLPLIIFAAWDVAATHRGHWSFNEEYITSFYFINLPVEEVLFFVIIPFCALFTWEVVKYYNRSKQ